MTSHSGRRAPNVSQYLANLNTVPSADDLAADFDLGDDNLDFLTNAEFFDFDNFGSDVAPPPDFSHSATQPPPPPPQQQSSSSASAGAQILPQSATAGVGLPGPQYAFGNFQTPPATGLTPLTGLSPTPPTDLVYAALPPHLTKAYRAQAVQQQQAAAAAAAAAASQERHTSLAGLPSAAEVEEDSRAAAEEDKRRRNTAASARFRVKKKQREQALERQTKEMTDKVHALERQVQQLEMENRWLKQLITEKSDGARPAGEAKGEESVGEKEGDERSRENRTDGVGTVDAEAEA